jgi:acetyltransferase-like isoleucine patch superfamily enzyme
MPVFSHWRSRWRLGRSAHVVVNGRLVVGRIDTKIGQIGQEGIDRNVIQLGEGAVFNVNGTVVLGPGVRILLAPNAQLTVGDGTYVTGASTFVVRTQLEIGRRCAIAWDVLLMDTDFHILDNTKANSIGIAIGDDVWIGAGARILKGVTIGSGAVIAAGTVVTRNVAPRQLVAGNPARTVREGVEWRS